MQKNTAILCTASNLYTFALFTTLKTFLVHSPTLAAQADIYVYTYKWPEKIKTIFKTQFPVTLLDFELPSFVPPSKMIDKFTPALFARFEAFSLLQKYQNVICLDSDILVQKELAGVLTEVQTSIGLSPDSCPTVGHNFWGDIPGYNLSAPCLNAGFMVLKNPLPAAKIKEWLYQMLAKYADSCYLGDQGLINLLLQEFNLKPTVLAALYNQPASSPTAILKKAYIIHSTGHRKFWYYYYFDEWYQSYAQWVALSGQAVTVRTPPNRKIWTWLLQKTGWDKKVFFQLAPDATRYPGKFVLFAIKRTLRIRY